MRFLRPLVGLIYDDAWLFFGTLAAAALSFAAAAIGLSGLSGPVLALGIVGALVLSLRRA